MCLPWLPAWVPACRCLSTRTQSTRQWMGGTTANRRRQDHVFHLCPGCQHRPQDTTETNMHPPVFHTHPQGKPRVSKLKAADVPIHTTPTGGRVRVIAGETGPGVASPLNPDLVTKVSWHDVALTSGVWRGDAAHMHTSISNALPACAPVASDTAQAP